MTSTNPANGQMLASFPELTDEELKAKLALAETAWASWKETRFVERAELMRKVGDLFRSQAPEIGKLATLEMGKPITQSIAEAEKCALVCDYYADNAETFLADETIKSDASESYVRYESIGAVLAVMPWNFPFWQVMRFAAPALMAGNVGLLKHASNVPQCAAAIERLFIEAGFPEGVFQNLAIGSARVEEVLRHPLVQGVALTGSEKAGSQVAALAGSVIKTSVLELGGSDPFIVLADADVAKATEVACKARFLNAGQSCIAAKRFVVVEEIYDAFLEAFKTHTKELEVGDPMNPAIGMGPLVNESGRAEIERQVGQSIERGARVVTGGQRLDGPGFFYTPTILAEVKPGMPVYDEEVFGPVAAVIKANNAEDAIRIANNTRFGLGSSLWTQNLELAKQLAPRIHAGSVFINGMVKSDPRLPFGGTGVSGYGRELSEHGIKEFVNVKTIWIA